MRDVEILRELVRGLRRGEARTTGPLTLVPLFGGRPSPGYVLAEDAMASGTLEVGELGGGVVPQLVVRNRGKEPVLILEGEHLSGARQDRVLNVTVLVPASSEIPIPVSCVEAGRWGYRAERAVRVEPVFSTPELRRTKVSSVAARRRATGEALADQRAVWAAVDRALVAVDACSPTSRLGDASARRSGDLEAILAEQGSPLPEQTGVLVCIGGRPVAADVFDRPGTLARLWPRLVRGYALDALGARASGIDEGAVEAFLAALAEGEASAHDGVGLGTEVVLTAADAVAAALVWQGAVIHLAAFEVPRRARAAGGGAELRGTPIAPPSRRRRRVSRAPEGWFRAPEAGDDPPGRASGSEEA